MPDNVNIKTGSGAKVATDERLINGVPVHVQIITEQSLKTLVDEAGSGITYIGYAPPGTQSSAAYWQIKRMTEVGTEIIIEWADGNDNFDNIWNNRASLVYS